MSANNDLYGFSCYADDLDEPTSLYNFPDPDNILLNELGVLPQIADSTDDGREDWTFNSLCQPSEEGLLVNGPKRAQEVRPEEGPVAASRRCQFPRYVHLSYSIHIRFTVSDVILDDDEDVTDLEPDDVPSASDIPDLSTAPHTMPGAPKRPASVRARGHSTRRTSLHPSPSPASSSRPSRRVSNPLASSSQVGASRARAIQVSTEEYKAVEANRESYSACPFCDAPKRRPKDFGRHLKSHCRVLFKLRCEGCGKIISRMDALLRHYVNSCPSPPHGVQNS